MKPNSKWINDWHTGIESAREAAISAELLKYFMDFWDKMKLDEKSKTTKRRYSSSLHALGGYLVEKATSDDDDLEDTKCQEFIVTTFKDTFGRSIGPRDADFLLMRLNRLRPMDST